MVPFIIKFYQASFGSKKKSSLNSYVTFQSVTKIKSSISIIINLLVNNNLIYGWKFYVFFDMYIDIIYTKMDNNIYIL